MSRRGRAQIALAALAVVAILFVFVFPSRAYFAQRRAVAAARRDVEVLRDQNAQLETEAERLQSRDAIEQMAREQFHYEFPGEQIYNILPQPAASTTTTVP